MSSSDMALQLPNALMQDCRIQIAPRCSQAYCIQAEAAYCSLLDKSKHMWN